MSESENETIPDILAEKRERANEIERDVVEKMASGEMVSDQYAREVISGIRKEADRIEAAFKREELRWAKANGELAHIIECEKATIGNAAAICKYAKRLVDAVKEADLCDFNYGAEFCKSCKYNHMCKAARDCESAIASSEGELTVNNAEAMREALVDAKLCLIQCLDGDNPPTEDDIRQEIEKIEESLAMPKRNCDVGTADEQHRRFVDYCNECDCPMGCIHRKEFIGARQC